MSKGTDFRKLLKTEPYVYTSGVYTPIEAKLADVPEIDQSRVDEIRQRLQSNTYEVDAEQLAQKILRLDQDLG